MLATPDVEAVKVDVHVAVAVVPDKVHVVKLPVTPVTLRLTAPVGVVGAALLSVTDTLQVEAWFTTTGVVHEIVVVVWWSPMFIGNAALALPAWVVSPP